MRTPRTDCSAANWKRALRCAAVVATLTGIVAVTNADTIAVPLSTTTTVFAHADWWDAMTPDSTVVDEDTGTNSAYAQATTPYGGVGASARINVTNSGGHTLIATKLYTEGYALDDGSAYADIQAGAITVGTSAEYPAGTPLLLTLSLTTSEEGSNYSSNFRLSLTRGTNIVLDITEYSNSTQKEWTCVAYAGETLTPALHHRSSGNPEAGAVLANVDMWTTVPEPTSLALLILGGLALRRR